MEPFIAFYDGASGFSESNHSTSSFRSSVIHQIALKHSANLMMPTIKRIQITRSSKSQIFLFRYAGRSTLGFMYRFVLALSWDFRIMAVHKIENYRPSLCTRHNWDLAALHGWCHAHLHFNSATRASLLGDLLKIAGLRVMRARQKRFLPAEGEQVKLITWE